MRCRHSPPCKIRHTHTRAHAAYLTGRGGARSRHLPDHRAKLSQGPKGTLLLALHLGELRVHPSPVRLAVRTPWVSYREGWLCAHCPPCKTHTAVCSRYVTKSRSGSDSPACCYRVPLICLRQRVPRLAEPRYVYLYAQQLLQLEVVGAQPLPLVLCAESTPRPISSAPLSQRVHGQGRAGQKRAGQEGLELPTA